MGANPWPKQEASSMKPFLPLIAAACALLVSVAAEAASVPGPADAGRVKPEERLPVPERGMDGQIALPAAPANMQAPKGAKNIRFTLKEVQIQGTHAVADVKLRHVYEAKIGQEITLDTAYEMAAEVTKIYRDAGYFLSLAYVPEQRIKNGVLKLRVVEGHINDVVLQDKASQQLKDSDTVRAYIARLKAKQPITSAEVESFLLRLNDLPGYNFSGVLSSAEGAEEGAVTLTLMPTEKGGRGTVGFDNASSRFLGPNEISAAYSRSLLHLQQTTVSGLTSLPTDKLNYVTLAHQGVIAPDVTLEGIASYTKAKPGYTLDPFDIDSNSYFLSLGVGYQWIRQRQENLSLKFAVDSRNTTSDILNSPLTRDRVRAARASLNYDASDQWLGYNIFNATLSQGIDGLGSSNRNDTYLSRAEARPDFTKLELAVSRLQSIHPQWSMLFSASAQKSSGPLFSAEEFGYGGQGFGRAFDSSEIAGDDGLSGAMELRYDGWADLEPVALSPYVFYDAGIVWNQDNAGQAKRATGTSAGLGIRANTPEGASGNVGLAWPLTRDAAAPIYGQSASSPRILLQLGKTF